MKGTSPAAGLANCSRPSPGLFAFAFVKPTSTACKSCNRAMREPEGTAIERHPRWPSPLCDNPGPRLPETAGAQAARFAGGRSGLRDRAILSVGLQVGLRRAEITANLCSIFCLPPRVFLIWMPHWSPHLTGQKALVKGLPGVWSGGRLAKPTRPPPGPAPGSQRRAQPYHVTRRCDFPRLAQDAHRPHRRPGRVACTAEGARGRA